MWPRFGSTDRFPLAYQLWSNLIARNAALGHSTLHHPNIQMRSSRGAYVNTRSYQWGATPTGLMSALLGIRKYCRCENTIRQWAMRLVNACSVEVDSIPRVVYPTLIGAVRGFIYQLAVTYCSRRRMKGSFIQVIFLNGPAGKKCLRPSHDQVAPAMACTPSTKHLALTRGKYTCPSTTVKKAIRNRPPAHFYGQ